MVQALMVSYEAIGFKRGRNVMVKLLLYLTDNLKLIRKRDKTVLLRHDPRRSHAVRRGMTAGAGIYNIQFNLVQIYIGKQTKLNWFHENK